MSCYYFLGAMKDAKETKRGLSFRLEGLEDGRKWHRLGGSTRHLDAEFEALGHLHSSNII